MFELSKRAFFIAFLNFSFSRLDFSRHKSLLWQQNEVKIDENVLRKKMKWELLLLGQAEQARGNGNRFIHLDKFNFIAPNFMGVWF